MADPRFWISLCLSSLLHVFVVGGLFLLVILGIGRVETAPLLLQPFGDSEAEGMKVATVSLDPGTQKEGTENTPGGGRDGNEPFRPADPAPPELPPEPPVFPEPKPQPIAVVPEPPVVVPEPVVAAPTPPEPKPREQARATKEAPKPTLPKETGSGVKGAGAPGGAALKPGTPSAGGKLGVSTGVDSSRIGKPAYPPLARAYKQQGVVRIRLRISAEGKVLEAHLIQSSGYPILDTAAFEFARNAAGFVPATRDGVPIETIDDLPVEFTLTDR